jgi:hypothetical protein
MVGYWDGSLGFTATKMNLESWRQWGLIEHGDDDLRR